MVTTWRGRSSTWEPVASSASRRSMVYSDDSALPSGETVSTRSTARRCTRRFSTRSIGGRPLALMCVVCCL